MAVAPIHTTEPAVAPQLRLPGWLVWLAERPWRLYPALVLITLTLHLPGQAGLPPLDRDEPRFAQATKQMVETGDYIQIAFQDQPRLKKPIGIYWLQALSIHATGAEPTDIWAYRLPSLLGIVAAVVLCAAIGGVLFAGPVGAAAGALFAPVLLASVEAHLAKTDAVLLAAVLAAQWGLARAWMAAHPGTARGRVDCGVWAALVFWLGIGAGVLLKGPVIAMIVGLTALGLCIWQRRVRWLGALKPLWGLPLALAMVAPWFAAIHLATDGAFWNEALSRDLLAKINEGQEAHGAPPGLYLLLVWATFWPATALLGLGTLAAWREGRAPAVQFCLAWIGPSWIVFELVATKLPHYVLPLYPAMALLCAYMLVCGGKEPARRWAARLVALPVWLAVAVATAMGLAAIALPIWLGLIPEGGSFAAAAAFAALAYSLFRLGQRLFVAEYPVGVVLVALVLAYWPAYREVVPSLKPIWLSPRLVEAAKAVPLPNCEGERTLISTGFSEPSLVFLAGTNTQLLSPEIAGAALLADLRCNIAAIEEKQWPIFAAQLPDADLVEEATVSGLNYSKGKIVNMKIVRANIAPK